MKVKENEKAGLKLNTEKTKIIASGPITSWQIDRETVIDFIFLGSKITADGDCRHEISCSWKKSSNKPRQCIKKQRYYFVNKAPYSQSCCFSSSRVQMCELDHEESWVLEKWCLQTVVLEKTLESPLDSKEIKPVNPKGNQPWIFIGWNEAPILWPPDAKSWLIGKDLDAGKDLRARGEMVGWHHWLNGHEFEQGDSQGQGSLACCSSWGHK